jgi:hypothetical protein
MKRHTPLWLLLLLSLCLCRVGAATQHLPEDVLEMKVKGVAIDPQGQTPVVVLEDAQGQQAFPIWVGVPEAQAIARVLEGVLTPRPMTHALLKNILADLQVDVVRIIITELRNNTFYAAIALRQGPKTLTIDARPSDALALALDVKAPIFVAKKVLGSVRTINLSAPPAPQHSAKKLGMHLQNLDAELASLFRLANSEGVLVSFVDAGSQAERHGIRRGDVITDLDGKHVKNLQDLLDMFKDKQIGQDMVLHVTRDQQPLKLRLALSSLE